MISALLPQRAAALAAAIATCAIVVLTGAAPAGASRSEATRLSPPTIRETFTVLPCRGAPDQRSTLELEGCAEHQILKSDLSPQ